jgi:hypothetical protein
MPQLTHIEVLRARLAPPRFDKYVLAAGGDTAKALRLYEWNSEVSAVFYRAIGQFEVLLRNALDRQLVTYNKKVLAGSGEWWNDPRMPFHPNMVGQLSTARSRAGGSNATHGKVIAELMFGFWRLLTDSQHSATLWAPALRHAFPHLRPKVRTEVYNRLKRLNTLRNRISHQEPIHHLSLEALYDDLLTVAGWICPTTAAWIWSTTSQQLQSVLTTKP